MLTVVLVVMVIFLFLRRLWATLIPGVAVPLSLIGTFGVMYLLGYSLNNLSLMALTISTGFVVDDAIVMIENIVRYIEQGEPPLEAALKGAKQIGFTIVSLTVSLIAVLIPLLFMARHRRPAVPRIRHDAERHDRASRPCVSLTLTPMMCARLLRARRASTSTARFYRSPSGSSTACSKLYGRALKLGAAAPGTTLLVTFAAHWSSPLPLCRRAQGILPAAGHRAILGITEAPQTISFRRMVEHQQPLAEIVLQDPGVASVVVVHRSGRHEPYAQQRAAFDQPEAARAAQSERRTVIARLRPKLRGSRGIPCSCKPVQDLSRSRVSRTQYQYTLEDADPNGA